MSEKVPDLLDASASSAIHRPISLKKIGARGKRLEELSTGLQFGDFPRSGSGNQGIRVTGVMAPLGQALGAF
jgi:hypothetical protein